MNVHFVEVIPGRGQIDYAAYLRELSRLPVDAPLMLEHLKEPPRSMRKVSDTFSESPEIPGWPLPSCRFKGGYNTP